MKNKIGYVVWVTLLCAYIVALITLAVTKTEIILLVSLILMASCIITELVLPKQSDESGLLRWLTSPSLILLIIPTLFLGGCAPYFDILVTKKFYLLTATTGLVLMLARWLRFHRKEPFDRASLILLIITFLFYWWVASFTYMAVNCECDKKVPEPVDAVVTEKGYCIDGIKAPDFKRRMVLVLETEEYGSLSIDVSQEDYEATENGDVIKTLFSKGVLGDIYYYHGASKWTYPYIKSTLMDKQFKEFIENEKCLDDE